MYIYTSLAWYLAIFTSKIFYKNSKFRFLLFFCFRQDRPTGPVDWSLYPGRARLCTSVGRPPGRPTECSLLSGFMGRPPGRPPAEHFVSFWGRSTRAQRLFASRADGRPDRSTARPAKSPTALSSLVQSEICFCDLFLADFFWVFRELFQIK